MDASAANPIVHVVDDDEALCEALQWLLESDGLTVRTHDSAERFLDEFDCNQPGCLVLDVRMRGMSGLDLQEQLQDRQPRPPVIILTGHGDVPMAVRAVKNGAFDFLEKPVNDHQLLECIHAALRADDAQRRDWQELERIRSRVERLTPRERETMQLVRRGVPNKQIALELGVSERTVEVHRKRVLEKMDVHSAVELANRLAILERSVNNVV